jgi:hypothetical protein
VSRPPTTIVNTFSHTRIDGRSANKSVFTPPRFPEPFRYDMAFSFPMAPSGRSPVPFNQAQPLWVHPRCRVMTCMTTSAITPSPASPTNNNPTTAKFSLQRLQCPPLTHETPRSCTPKSLWPPSAQRYHGQLWACSRHLSVVAAAAAAAAAR